MFFVVNIEIVQRNNYKKSMQFKRENFLKKLKKTFLKVYHSEIEMFR